jgi:DNA-binding CsgD family transcriptional regulator
MLYFHRWGIGQDAAQGLGRHAMTTTWSTERAEQEIIRLCHSGLDSRTLRVAVFDRLQCVMPYAAFWCATTDPSTLLFTGAVHDGFETLAVAPLVSNEYQREDFNKFTDLAKSRQTVSTLRMATGGDLMRSPRYREILEPKGLGHELRAVFRSGGAVWGALCLHRERRFEDFTPAHVQFFAAIAPHLAAGLRAALLLDTVITAPAVDGPGLLILADDLSVVATTPGAEALLDEVCDWSERLALPLAVYAVVTRLRALEHDAQQAASVIPYVRLRTRAGRWLALHASRLSPQESTGQIAVIIEQAAPDAIAPFVLQAYALTPREQELAMLVLRGCSTEEISNQLCIAALTVQQHLKAIFDKIGVRSRRDLVAQVFARSYWPALAADQGVAPEQWAPEQIARHSGGVRLARLRGSR